MKHLVSTEETRKHAEHLRELAGKSAISSAERTAPTRVSEGALGWVRTRVSRTVQAFWAVYVEAMNWRGTSVRDYITALLLSPRSLRRWCDRLDDGDVEVDRPALLLPRARPQISTNASSAAKESDGESVLTAPAPANPVRDGRPNRRSFADAEKLAIAMEAERPSVSVAAVCRRHYATALLFSPTSLRK